MSSEAKQYGKPWTRSECVLAFDLYCRIPFSKTTARNPHVQKLAALLGRSAGAVARKLGNFGAHDPALRPKGIAGLKHGSSIDRDVWEEFHADWDGLVAEAARLRANLDGEAEPLTPAAEYTGKTERLTTQKQRVCQGFFRAVILSSYETQCCITGISIPAALIASHIVPWREAEAHRADPTNGLCLSATFDRLFDSGLMTVNTDYCVRFARELIACAGASDRKQIMAYEGIAIRAPRRFRPSAERLAWHVKNVFKG